MSFNISDAFLPDSMALKAGFPDMNELDGTVVGFSDSGDIQRAFALVEVIQKRIIVVPIERLKALGNLPANRARQDEEE